MATLRTVLLLFAATVTTAAPAGVWDRDAAPTEFLPVDVAFVPQPPERHGDRLRLAWDIQPGYYLYEHALQVSGAPGVVRFGPPQFEGGEPYHDEHFGEVRIHRGQMVVWLPITGGSPRTVTVRYQGCADAGLCYPPQTRTLEIETL